MQRMNKYGHTQVLRKLLLFSFLLFRYPDLQAQYDSTNVTDTVIKEIDSAAPQEDMAIPGEGKKATYFSPLSAFREEADSLQLRQLPDSLVKQMQEDDDFWYANAELKKKKPERAIKNYTPLGDRTWFKTLIWLIIIGGFAGFIMWYLAGTNVGLFRKASKAINQSAGEEELTEDIFAINYAKEIEKAAQQGNYRLAVRLLFLHLLKNMSEKNIIAYKLDRTNFDYLLQLHSTPYYSGFFRLARNYEYTWYGQFDVTSQTYAVIRNDFENFSSQI